MVHARNVFLSVLASAAFVLGVTPGCSSNSSPPPTTAIGTWSVAPGLLSTNDATHCGAGAGATFSIGNPESLPAITTVASGGSSSGIGVTVSCTVSSASGGFNVSANVTYGSKGSLTILGNIPDPNGNATPPTATGVHGQFTANFPGFVASLSDPDCTVTFTKNPGMGIAPSRVWGTIDCPNATDASNGQTCDASAEFLFEDCGQ